MCQGSTLRSIVTSALALLLAANTAHAANIVVERPETPTSQAVVSVTGQMSEGDYDAFIVATQHMKIATIYFYSEGGMAFDAVMIGTMIHKKSFNTTVADRHVCFSACALARLRGLEG
jgi:hypothetical protein